MKEIDHQVKSAKPDIIIGFQIISPYLAMRYANKYKIPFVYFWTDVYHCQIPFKLYQTLGKLIERKTLKGADKVVAINEKLRDLVVEMGANPNQSYIVRGSVDLHQFNPDGDRNKIRERYGIKRDDVVFIFVGWLYHFSGLKEAAIQLARISNNKFKLLIVGEGDAYNELKKIQEKNNLQDRVILTGKKPYKEICDFIAASDICLLPAYPTEKIMQDIVPIKMYEYMAMKKPVIATKLPGVVKEFGEDNGVVYIDKPEEAIEKAIEIIQSGSAEKLGSKARIFAERNNWDKNTDAFESILEDAIRKKA
jgi:glycosyltransferase involved in cell wall biosynthesis